MKKLIIISVIILVALNLNAQNKRNLEFKWINYEEIFKADVNNIIKIKSMFKEGWLDSVQCLYFNGIYWKTLAVKLKDNRVWGQYFAFDKNNNKLYCLNDSLIEFSSIYSDFVERTFKDNLYYIVHYKYGKDDEGSLFGRKIVVIDTDKIKVKKEIFLSDNCTEKKVEIVNDTLYVYIQPLKKIINIHYYLLFWMPRGRGEKYMIVDDGNMIVYKYDKNFNFIEKKEIVRN